jgi:hypothetical protein
MSTFNLHVIEQAGRPFWETLRRRISPESQQVAAPEAERWSPYKALVNAVLFFAAFGMGFGSLFFYYNLLYSFFGAGSTSL